MQAGSIQPGQNVVVVDDLLATGTQTRHHSVYVHANRWAPQEGLLRVQAT